MPLMHSFSWHGPLTDILTGYAERYPMPSSPTLQPQRGVGGKSVVDEAVIEVAGVKTVLDELAEETVVGDEVIACNVVTAVDDVGKSCDVQLPGDIVE